MIDGRKHEKTNQVEGVKAGWLSFTKLCIILSKIWKNKVFSITIFSHTIFARLYPETDATCELTTNTFQGTETNSVINTTTNEPIAYEVDINILPEDEDTPFTYCSSITN